MLCVAGFAWFGDRACLAQVPQVGACLPAPYAPFHGQMPPQAHMNANAISQTHFPPRTHMAQVSQPRPAAAVDTVSALGTSDRANQPAPQSSSIIHVTNVDL